MASKKRARSMKKGRRVKRGRRTKANKTVEKIMKKGKVTTKEKTPRKPRFKKVGKGPTKTPRPGRSMRAPKRQYALPVEEMPTKWYNILADLPDPLPPPKDPEHGESRLSALPEMLLAECLKQEMSTERWINIPDELLSLYAQAGRPRQLFRALSLEKHLGTPARLYYKAEFYSPTGSHKVNTALAQAFYAKEEGYERLTTETGAGQWGTALAYAASLAGLRCTVYWVRAVYSWKSARKNLMQLMGADVYASPSDKTETGRKLFEKDTNHPGSLGIAISEGLEDARSDRKAIYCLGSVLNHVLLHQTVIGLETQRQFEMAKDYPDIVISCLGGGSNFGGFAFPFVGDVLTKGNKIRFIAAQSEAAPNLQGEYKYDFADHAEMTPLLKMYTLGHKTSMRPIRGDGLRYHGCSPIVSYLRNKGLIDTVAYPVDEKHVFDRARTFVRHEGFLPAPESAYSIACAIDEAIKCKETGEEKVIAFNISGHGFMDMEGYAAVLGL
jgi:tryptophan synthase beta chain